MKLNEWTTGLAALGVISLGSVVQADEAQQPLMTALSSTTISGYVSTSAILKFGHGSTVWGRSFDGTDKQNGFNFDVAKLQIEKPLDEARWSAGYQLGLLFGPDANAYNTGSSALDNSDFGIKDANVTLRTPVGNGLDFKMGYWESPIGYEVFDSGNNPNFSRSFAYAIEPKQFTGLLATYKFNDVVSVAGGVANRGLGYGTPATADANTWGNTRYRAFNGINGREINQGGIYDWDGDGVDDGNPYDDDSAGILTYLGSVALTAPESMGFLKGATLYGGIIDSGIDGGSDIQNYYVGLTAPTPLTGLVFGAAYDYVHSGDTAGGFDSANAWAISGYLSYQATEKLRLNARVEYARGDNGTWYWTEIGKGDTENNMLLGVTGTIDYTLWANVLTRLEFRWDRELHGNGIFGSVPSGDANALSLALNVIYKF